MSSQLCLFFGFCLVFRLCSVFFLLQFFEETKFYLQSAFGSSHLLAFASNHDSNMFQLFPNYFEMCAAIKCKMRSYFTWYSKMSHFEHLTCWIKYLCIRFVNHFVLVSFTLYTVQQLLWKWGYWMKYWMSNFACILHCIIILNKLNSAITPQEKWFTISWKKVSHDSLIQTHLSINLVNQMVLFKKFPISLTNPNMTIKQ